MWCSTSRSSDWSCEKSPAGQERICSRPAGLFSVKATIRRRLGCIYLNPLRCNAYPGASFLSTEGMISWRKSCQKVLKQKEKWSFYERIILLPEESNVVKTHSFFIERLDHVHPCATSKLCIFISHLYWFDWNYWRNMIPWIRQEASKLKLACKKVFIAESPPKHLQYAMVTE